MKSKMKIISCLTAVVLCMAVFSVTAFALDRNYYASNETGTETPPDYIDSVIIETESVKLPEKNNAGLTPSGNMSLIDDILQENAYVSEEHDLSEKQFITIQTKNGNYFYLIIDRTGGTENVYFLNLVDEADLLALLEDGETDLTVATCNCTDMCMVGSINTLCEICRTNMSKCIGKEAIIDTEPEPDLEDPDTEPDRVKKSSNLLPIVLLAVGGIGGAVYWFKFHNKQPQNKGGTDLDDYDFGQEEDEEEETEENEDEEND